MQKQTVLTQGTEVQRCKVMCMLRCACNAAGTFKYMMCDAHAHGALERGSRLRPLRIGRRHAGDHQAARRATQGVRQHLHSWLVRMATHQVAEVV